MKVSSKNIEFPDKCPQECPARNETFDQGNICSRCPILNCKKVPYPGTPKNSTNPEDFLCLIEPEDFDVSAAEAYLDYIFNK